MTTEKDNTLQGPCTAINRPSEGNDPGRSIFRPSIPADFESRRLGARGRARDCGLLFLAQGGWGGRAREISVVGDMIFDKKL